MADQSENTQNMLIYLVVWCIAGPILAVWALVSLLPLVSVLRAWGDFTDVIVAFGFLGTGAFGVIAAAIGYRWLLWGKQTVPGSTLESRTLRAVALAAYAAVWLALYAVV